MCSFTDELGSSAAGRSGEEESRASLRALCTCKMWARTHLQREGRTRLVRVQKPAQSWGTGLRRGSSQAASSDAGLVNRCIVTEYTQNLRNWPTISNHESAKYKYI